MATPVRGRDYPGSYGEMRAWFPNDADCLDYLSWLRWGDGFSCPHCGGKKAWELPDGRRSCANCQRKVSATAGTIFHGTRTPLTLWFAAAWHMTSEKSGVSATHLKRVLGFGSYQTPWAILHRYRTAMVRPDRERLSGEVEVDETMVGGARPGKRGRGAEGKTMVVIAVERHPATKPGRAAALGRVRLGIVPTADSANLRAFLLANVEPGATVITDALSGYPRATRGLYAHQVYNLSATGVLAHVVLPGVHRVASLLKRWILGTHHGAIESDHLGAYLDEFTFRFNRRGSRARGLLFYRLLELAVKSPQRTYVSLVADPGRPKRTQPKPAGSHNLPRSLVMTVPERPWRAARPVRRAARPRRVATSRSLVKAQGTATGSSRPAVVAKGDYSSH